MKMFVPDGKGGREELKVFRGDPGPQGDRGPQGEPGPPGKDGKPGTTSWSGITDKPDVTPFLRNGSIVQRDSNGRSYINSPNSNFDIANKGYVDAEVRKKADTSHKHTMADISDLPPVENKVVGGAIVKRFNNGVILVPDPATSDSATPKSYVDAEVGKKADTAHKHTMSDISDLPGCTYDNKGNSLVLRDDSGAANISAPRYPMHITNKQYVDNAIAGCASKGDLQSLIRLVDSPPSSPTSGVLYVIPEA